MEGIRVFHLYGDNVVECERVLEILKTSLQLTDIVFSGNPTNLVSSSYSALIGDVSIIYFPGFGRWKIDVLQFLRDSGGILREAADCIITEVKPEGESLVLAIEFCSALPAGNQAWQRSGRAYSFARANLPYIYLTEIGGYELDADRSKKAARMPNPAVPFSYISYSNSQENVVLIVYQFSPGADNKNKKTYETVVGLNEMNGFIAACLHSDKPNQMTHEKHLEKKVLTFVEGLANQASSTKSTYTADEWAQLYDLISKGHKPLDAIGSLRKIDWKKKASIKGLTPTVRQLMNLASKYGQGITSRDLPMCLIHQNKIVDFVSEFKAN